MWICLEFVQNGLLVFIVVRGGDFFLKELKDGLLIQFFFLIF